MKRYLEIFKTTLRITVGKKFTVFQMFLSCALYNLSGLLPPIATAGIIAVITENNFYGVWHYVFLYLTFIVIYYTMLSWNYDTYKILSNYYYTCVQKRLFDHISLNDSIFNKISKGKITATCTEDIKYLVDVMDASSEALFGLVKMFIIFIIFLYYDIPCAIFTLTINILYLILMNDNSKKISKHYEGIRKYEDKILDLFSQVETNLKQIKSLNIMPKINKKIDNIRQKRTDEYFERRKLISSRYCYLPYIVYIAKITLYVFLGYLVVNKKLTIDKLILLISYFDLTISCSDNTLENSLNLSNYGVRIKRIYTILNYTSNGNIDFGDINNDYIKGSIKFDNVYYEIKDKKILNNVSFKIYPNEITAIIGKSGSGKTTIMNLLYRLDRVKSGSILVDDESIYNYSNEVYSSNVSGVFQNPFIFEMSIKENLSLVDTNIKNQIDACKRVGIHDYIMSLPKQYNTVISEEENLFSDGQKQLLTIARALLSKAEILLFDEVTSNIDNETSLKIIDILKDLKEDHTVVIITHKPSLMAIADKIIVLDNGKVETKGLNKEVYKKSKIYKELKNMTFASGSKIE